MTEALIGPNAIIQVADAIRREFGSDHLLHIMQTARLGHFVAEPPQHMVSEGDVVRLHRAVAASLPVEAGRALMWQAGENTAQYLLANRIPRLAQTVLKLLPAVSFSPAASDSAISRHAWTFAGSSTFRYSTHPHRYRSRWPARPCLPHPPAGCLAEAYFHGNLRNAAAVNWSAHAPGLTRRANLQTEKQKHRRTRH
jgi:bacteriochlorophyll 4-vinyl reductase